MATLEPRVDFAALSDKEIADFGLDMASATFYALAEFGVLNGDSLVVAVGTLQHEFTELGSCGFGSDFEQFESNIDPKTGKLASPIEFGVDSIHAYYRYDDDIPKGPQRFTGAVHHIARVKTVDNGWMHRTFVGAASGVQGHFDQEVVYAALTHMGALWALKMLAHYGKPAS